MKKGQMFGQPIMYIFMAIVGVLILGFGIKLAVDFNNTGKEITIKAFTGDIEKKVNSVYTDSFGSVISLEDVRIPSTVTEICFLDSEEEGINLNVVQDKNLRQVVNESYEIVSDKNVFIKADKVIIEKIELLDLDNSLVCDDLKDNKIDIKLTNSGTSVKAEHI